LARASAQWSLLACDIILDAVYSFTSADGESRRRHICGILGQPFLPSTAEFAAARCIKRGNGQAFCR
jgi:hypothetical protein